MFKIRYFFKKKRTHFRKQINQKKKKHFRNINIEIEIEIHRNRNILKFFYKQHFYKQHQTEIGKKSSKG